MSTAASIATPRVSLRIRSGARALRVRHGGAGAAVPLLARVPEDVLALLPPTDGRLERVAEVILPVLVALDVLPIELILASARAAAWRVAPSHGSRWRSRENGASRCRPRRRTFGCQAIDVDRASQTSRAHYAGSGRAVADAPPSRRALETPPPKRRRAKRRRAKGPEDHGRRLPGRRRERSRDD